MDSEGVEKAVRGVGFLSLLFIIAACGEVQGRDQETASAVPPSAPKTVLLVPKVAQSEQLAKLSSDLPKNIEEGKLTDDLIRREVEHGISIRESTPGAPGFSALKEQIYRADVTGLIKWFRDWKFSQEPLYQSFLFSDVSRLPDGPENDFVRGSASLNAIRITEKGDPNARENRYYDLHENCHGVGTVRDRRMSEALAVVCGFQYLVFSLEKSNKPSDLESVKTIKQYLADIKKSDGSADRCSDEDMDGASGPDCYGRVAGALLRLEDRFPHMAIRSFKVIQNWRAQNKDQFFGQMPKGLFWSNLLLELSKDDGTGKPATVDEITSVWQSEPLLYRPEGRKIKEDPNAIYVGSIEVCSNSLARLEKYAAVKSTGLSKI